MEPKKSPKANLEKRKAINYIIGILVSLSLVLISFEWTNMSTILSDVYRATEISAEEIMMPVIPREELRPAIKPKTPPIAIIMKLVDEDPVLEPIIWDPEYIPGDAINIPDYPDDGPEILPGPEDVIISEIMPQFKGGEASDTFLKYIYSQLVYPSEAVENGLSGRVIVKFVVNSKGYIERAEILQGVHPSLDQEALRVINSSPRWEPGVQSGSYVNVIFTFPIKFILH